MADSSVVPEARSAAARRFTIYGLVDPRDGLVHYIGRTVNPKARLAAHHSSPVSFWRGAGKARTDWIGELRGLGLRPTFRELEQVDAFEEAVEAEARWIASGLEQKWPLTNRQKSGRAGQMPKDLRLAKREAERREREERRARWARQGRIQEQREPVRFTFTIQGLDRVKLRKAARLLGASEEEAIWELLLKPGGDAFEKALDALELREALTPSLRSPASHPSRSGGEA